MAVYTWKDVQESQLERAMPRIIAATLNAIDRSNYIARSGSPPLPPTDGYYDESNNWVSYFRLDFDEFRPEPDPDPALDPGCAP